MTPLLVLIVSFALVGANVDGAKIHYSTHGTGLRTVFLVHGWSCDESVWQEQVPALQKNYRVVTLDLPGHGRSQPPRDGKFSMELFARAIEAVRRDVKADRIVLVGHSMGTPVIVQYARSYPQHVSALVFVDGVTAGNRNRPRHHGAEMAGPDGVAHREAMVQGMFSPNTNATLRQRILKMMLATPEATAVGALDATLAATSHDEGVLALPVLAVYAEHSRQNARAYLESHYPRLQYVEMPGTGHFLMLEKPDEFNKLLVDFLNQQTRGTAP